MFSSVMEQTELSLGCFPVRFVQVNVARLTVFRLIAGFVHLADFRFVPCDPVAGPATHSVLWNAMIHPLQNMTLKGVVWYQGELAHSPLCQLALAV